MNDRARSVQTEPRTLDTIQRDAFDRFLHETSQADGSMRDRTCPDRPASIVAVGTGLSAYPVAVERGLVKRINVAARFARWFLPDDGPRP